MILILPSIRATPENVYEGIHPLGLKLVICDCRFLLPELPNVHVSFVKRSANLAAHFVARGAQAYANQFVNGASAPPELTSVLEADSIN